MSRICELSGIGVQSGHQVSHSQIKTNRKFNPNLQRINVHSDVLKLSFRLRITPKALRTIEKKGGLDAYLLDTKDDLLSLNALKIKRQIKKISSK